MENNNIEGITKQKTSSVDEVERKEAMSGLFGIEKRPYHKYSPEVIQKVLTKGYGILPERAEGIKDVKGILERFPYLKLKDIKKLADDYEFDGEDEKETW